ncbi:DUF6787 family protein [Mangrovimonas cancribranchiae]|uniref:DUF6787 family protein n=1 Tax=Mangrovimonas cancribranchiae TaxID=3080055 RepID=A0AAU6P044_9FLAO
MDKFKKRWEIQKNWQLLFPALGILGIVYSAFKLTSLFIDKIYLIPFGTIAISFTLIKLTLWIFEKLKHKWVLDYRWEMIRVFIVFAITGSTSAYIGRPILQLIGITKENLNPIVYWVIFIIIGLIFYQILLVSFGWLFGQFKFFWEFEKKMLRRFGLKRFID